MQSHRTIGGRASASMLLGAALMLLAACGGRTSAPAGDAGGQPGTGAGAPPAATSPAAQAEGTAPAASSPGAEAGANVQVARVQVTASGFEPARVELQAGKPARLIFTRITDDTCAKEVQMPDFGVRKALPLNQEVAVEFTPGKAGEHVFACGMDMVKGAVVVAP